MKPTKGASIKTRVLDSTKAELELLAKELNLDVADLVRAAIDQYLKKQSGVLAEAKKPEVVPGEGSFVVEMQSTAKRAQTAASRVLPTHSAHR